MKKTIPITLFMLFLLTFSTTAFAALDAPTGVTTEGGPGTISVSWDVVSGAEGYNVYVDSVKHNVSLITSTSYQITGLVEGQTYAITVTSWDSDSVGTEESTPSNVVNQEASSISTVSEMVTMAQSTLDMVQSGISLFLNPPLVWFVSMAAMAAGLGIAARMIPRKRAK